MNRDALKFAMLAGLFGTLVVGSITALAYLCTVWFERGLFVGATSAGGSTAPGEKLLLIVSALGMPAFGALGAIFLVMFLRRRRPQQI